MWDNSPADFYPASADPTGVDGNVSVAPGFLAFDPAVDVSAWDFHLTLGSPLVDAGDPTVLDPDGSPSDIGAFGGPGAGSWDLDGDGDPEWWQPGLYDASYPALGWDCDDSDPAIHSGTGC